MGFYGNITNTNKTQFTFDRTYPNRKTMETRLATDEIYLGRYVLIEYDTINDYTLDSYLKCYMKIGDSGLEEFYTSPNFENNTRVKWSKPVEKDTTLSNLTPSIQNTVTTKQLIYIDKDLTPDDNNHTVSHVFYQCTNAVDSADGTIATFRYIVPSETPYTSNYNIDTATYGPGRGYDSTVWQKVYMQNTEKYVMIAELNTVVPTFDLVADAPTMEPITPHFDANSTNVYYKLHWQPQWGLRVAAQSAGMNSDETVYWKKTIYDPETNTTTTELISDVAAAINYNKPAFDPYQTTFKHDNSDNYFTILPTGKSGQLYNTHNNTGELKQAEDIQEIRVNLPAIGNMMSDAWDIIHGPNRDDDSVSSLQGRLNLFKYMSAQEIPVQSTGGYLVGSTVTGDDWIQPTVDVKILEGDSKYHQDAITVVHTYDIKNEGQELTTFSCKNGNKLEEELTSGLNHGKGDTLKLYTPQVDEMGHVIGNTIETVTLPYSYKTFTIGEQSADVEELTANTFKVTADNTQDSMTITSANKWIRLAGAEDKIQMAHTISAQTPVTVGNETKSPKFGESFTIPRFTTDEAGHITAASDQTITLQVGSYTPASAVSESTEVITSIGFDAATGDITSTKADSSTLKLASYSAGTDATDVANGDTYNSAFAKLQNQINGLDYGESSTTQIITAINQVDGLISVTRGDAGTLLLTGYELKESEGSDADLLATDNLKTAFSKLQRQIHVEEAARAAAINALDVSEIATEAYEVISAVSEVDGKISAKTKKAGTLTLSDYSKPSSGSAISPSDTLNAALGKLEYKLDAEIKRVDDLDYADPNTNTTQIITKVTQTDGKISVERGDAGTLVLTGYDVGTDGEKIASTDSINNAFAKLQTQIVNLTADANSEGSVAHQIQAAIQGLDSEKTATAGKYISGIHIIDGKIDSIDETALPTVSWSDVKDKPTDLVTSNQIVNMVEDTDIEGMVTESSPFTYPAIKDSTGAEISPADAAMTIALLFEKVAALEARIYALENPATNETPEPTPEEGGEETPTE